MSEKYAIYQVFWCGLTLGAKRFAIYSVAVCYCIGASYARARLLPFLWMWALVRASRFVTRPGFRFNRFCRLLAWSCPLGGCFPLRVLLPVLPTFRIYLCFAAYFRWWGILQCGLVWPFITLFRPFSSRLDARVEAERGCALLFVTVCENENRCGLLRRALIYLQVNWLSV